ncbi:DUF2190 family protein [Dichelobacter nodosus]|uniref:Uncharacterized protein n=1 Tax=Dichelobacter nodosus (strain VCS1703A) TaxID=246195 RepID=A5EV03_DICNV|nr:DUF2190 family protein [Dichelobacter nodosus]ABQ14254.1 hypothetical protein DNO_0746 [Dichelobacter nodosus VCS1703A]
MTETIPYERPQFLHWEANPHVSREIGVAKAAIKAGDVVLATDGVNFEVLKDGTPPPPSTGDAPKIGFALEDAAAGAKFALVVRFAVILIDKLNHVTAASFAKGGAFEFYGNFFPPLNIILKKSVDVQRGVKP